MLDTLDDNIPSSSATLGLRRDARVVPDGIVVAGAAVPPSLPAPRAVFRWETL